MALHSLRKMLTRVSSIVLLLIALINSITIIQAYYEYDSRTLESFGTIAYSKVKGLHTLGTEIIDENGNAVILLGAGFQGYELGAWDSHTESDYEKMASWGFNIVRLPIAWSYIEPEPGVYNSSYFYYINRDISWAEKYGLYIILDMHQYKWSAYFGGCGLPTWAVSGYEKSQTGMGLAITDFWTGKGPNGTLADENNLSMKERFVDVWRFIAQKYANVSSIAAYELFNEPPDSIQYVSSGLDPEETASYLYPLYCTTIAAIRAIDPNHIIAYEPVGGWSSRTARLLDYPNLVYTFHYYYGLPYSGNISELEQEFVYRYQCVSPVINPCAGKIPCWLGEVGVEYPNPNDPKADQLVKDIVSLCSKYGITWQWWCMWKDDTGYALLYSNGTEKQIVQFLKLVQPAS